MRTVPRTSRGFTLLELMISLSVLLIGLVGMAYMQVVGIRSNLGSRVTARAMLIAEDLAAGLDALTYKDATGITNPAFTMTVASISDPPPEPFGYLLSGGVIASGGLIHDAVADPSILPPGVIPDAQIERDPLDPGKPLYQRRWTVWEYQPAGATVVTPMVAISVVYREGNAPALREIVLYHPKLDPGGLLRGLVVY